MNKIQRVSVIDVTVSQIKDLIISGAMSVGDKLPTEMELCERCGVGRSTVREACRTLKAMGYIEMQPGRGMFVTSPASNGDEDAKRWFAIHKPEVIDYFDVRFALEPYAVRLATKRADDAEIAELSKLHKEYVRLIDSGNAERLSLYDKSFHEQIVEMSHNEIMMSIIRRITDDIVKYVTKVNTISSKPEITAASHASILSAITSRDAESGALAMTAHLTVAQEEIRRIIEQ